jgi:hypothetical protein
MMMTMTMMMRLQMPRQRAIFMPKSNSHKKSLTDCHHQGTHAPS